MINYPRFLMIANNLMLPGTDGIALMRDVAALARLPVIFISAYGRDETVARALEAGAVDYIAKPGPPRRSRCGCGPRAPRPGPCR